MAIPMVNCAEGFFYIDASLAVILSSYESEGIPSVFSSAGYDLMTADLDGIPA